MVFHFDPHPSMNHWRMGLSMDYLWIIYGLSMDYPMEGQYEWRMGLSMGLFHLSMGLSVDYLWIIYGLSMDCRKEWICFKENMFFRFCEFQCLVLF